MTKLEDILFPPNDFNLEKLWLAMLTYDISKLDELDEYCFYSEDTKKVFNAIKKTKSTEFTILSVESWLDNDIVLSLITDLVSKSDYNYIIEQLHKYKNARTIIRWIKKLEWQARVLEIDEAKETIKKLDKFIQDIKKDETLEEQWMIYFDDLYKTDKIISSGYDVFDKLVQLRWWQLVVVAWRPSMWKELSEYTIIPTPNWNNTLWNLCVWDIIFDDKWNKTKVIWKYEPNDNRVYKIVFSDWTEVNAWHEHLWEVWDRKNRKLKYWIPQILNTWDMIDRWVIINKEKRCNFSIETSSIKWEHKNLLINPYTLWVRLWDWNYVSSKIRVKNWDEEILDNIWKYHYLWSERWCKRYYIDWLITKIKKIWLYWNKRIPKEYLLSSKQQRLDLLAWLLDTDWTIYKRGTIVFSTSIKWLADDVMELISSLWYIPHITSKIPKYKYKWQIKEWKISYSISFITTDKVFRLKRKNKRIKKNIKKFISNHRYIKSIEKIEKKERYFCIEVDSESKLFLCTNRYIRTHNTTVMQNIALRQSIKNRVWFISIEMTISELIDRFICIIWWLNSYNMRNKKEYIQEIQEYLSPLLEKKLFLSDKIYNLSRIEQYIAKNELDVCYIDYLWLINYWDSKMRIIDRISEITKQLKEIAKKRNCCIILWSQLSRDVEKRIDKYPILADLRDSWTIEQDADIVIMLYREDYYDDWSENKNKIQLFVRKNRNWELWCIELETKFSSYRLLDNWEVKKPF